MLSRPSTLVAKRFASAAAASRGAQERTSVLNDGLSVSSIELNGAASSLVLAFRAGSRYQPSDKQGLVHLIRNSIGRDSDEYPGFSLVWNTATNGGTINAVSNRDILAIEMNVVRDNVEVALSLLGQLGKNAFKPWDTEDVKNETLKLDEMYTCGNTIVFEKLHQAAYRNGSLGLSNFVVNKIGSGDLLKFAGERLTAGEAVLVGVNVDHDVLVNVASQEFPIAAGSGKPATPSKYYGGEVRENSKSNYTIVGIAGEGASLKSLKDLAVQHVVAQILTTAVQKVNSDAVSVNVSYQDSGLVGVQFSAENSKITDMTKSVVAAIKSANANDLDVAKNTAALNMLVNSQNASNVALDRACQILAGNEGILPVELAQAIKNVAANDVTQALSRVTGKLSLAAYGTPSLVPYLDEM